MGWFEIGAASPLFVGHGTMRAAPPVPSCREARRGGQWRAVKRGRALACSTARRCRTARSSRRPCAARTHNAHTPKRDQVGNAVRVLRACSVCCAGPTPSSPCNGRPGSLARRSLSPLPCRSSVSRSKTCLCMSLSRRALPCSLVAHQALQRRALLLVLLPAPPPTRAAIPLAVALVGLGLVPAPRCEANGVCEAGESRFRATVMRQQRRLCLRAHLCREKGRRLRRARCGLQYRQDQDTCGVAMAIRIRGHSTPSAGTARGSDARSPPLC